MRRITLWALSTLTSLVLLFSYHTSTSSSGSGVTAPVVAPVGSPGTSSGSSGTSSDGTGSSSSGSSGSSGSSSGSSSSSSSSRTYTGDSVDTRWGPVQVRITVQGGRIVAAEAVDYPHGNREDEQINGYALPVLAQEAVAAQSARIDMVSGATVTSEGYLRSLQSAIDAAHL